MSREMLYVGLSLLKRLEVGMVDSLMVMVSKVVYGDLSKYGITRPSEGPFYMKVKYGKYPVVDVGTYKKIKSGEIQVRFFIFLFFFFKFQVIEVSLIMIASPLSLVTMLVLE